MSISFKLASCFRSRALPFTSKARCFFISHCRYILKGYIKTTTKSDINVSLKSVKYIQIVRSRIQNNIRKSLFSTSPIFIFYTDEHAAYSKISQ